MKKVEQPRADKMRKKECFSSLKPCDRKSEQNETDEPPSLLLPINAVTGLNRLFETPISPARFPRCLPVLSLSKNRFFQTQINGTHFSIPLRGALFSTPLRGRKTQGIISNLLRDKRGRIKTIIFKQKRSM